jgi:hypothetical protein
VTALMKTRSSSVDSIQPMRPELGRDTNNMNGLVAWAGEVGTSTGGIFNCAAWTHKSRPMRKGKLQPPFTEAGAEL